MKVIADAFVQLSYVLFLYVYNTVIFVHIQVENSVQRVLAKEKLSQSKALELQSQLNKAKSEQSQLKRSKDEVSE